MAAPTTAEIKDSLLRSGYPLESRIAATLAGKDFYVVPNEVYPDPHTGKPGELNIYAISASKVGKGKNYIFPVLLIECVNNSVPMAFFVKDQDSSAALLDRGAIKIAGIPMVLPDGNDTFLSLTKYLKMDEYHHYWKGKVASQFCSFAKKKDISKSEKWVASHEDPHFDYFRTLISATEYQIDALLNNLVAIKYKKTRAPKKGGVGVEFYYPVLVVQGEILEVSPGKKALEVKPVKHIQFQYRSVQNPIVQGQIRHLAADTNIYRIDVVTESFFPKYVAMIKKEMNMTASRIEKDPAVVKKALAEVPDHINTMLKRGSTPRSAFTLSGFSSQPKPVVKIRK